MNGKCKILTILGSPHDKRSNTRALVEDFVEEVAGAGLELAHEIIPLGRREVAPCKGCWNCTTKKPCPLAHDDLAAIKAAMLECDLLILACPVYTNQVTAQMKAFHDRLFTWCHIFPLLGTYSLSACTTGNDGHGAVGVFLQKMLATYGTASFGHIHSIGGFNPGSFPWRARARLKYRKLAQRVAQTLMNRRSLPVSPLQRRMFRVMKHKMSGVQAIRCLRNGADPSQPAPSRLRLRIMRYFFKRLNITDQQLEAWSKLMSFELDWWQDLGWLGARSFKQLARRPIPQDFDLRERLLAEAL